MGRAIICWQYFLLGATLFVGISGLVVIAASGYFIHQFRRYEPLTPENVYGSAAILSAMGVLTSLLAWYMWRFTNFGNKGQVILLGFSFGVISSFEMSAGIWALVRHENVLDINSIPRLQSMFAIANHTNLTTEDDKLAREFCCDIVGVPDRYDEDSFHWSCCNVSSPISSSGTKEVCTSIYTKGCLHVIINHTRSVLLHIFLLAESSVLLQVCFVSCIIHYMKGSIKRKKRRATVCSRYQLSPQAGVSNDDSKSQIVSASR